MDVSGYDPCMTIESALKLPRETQILGGMKAIAKADHKTVKPRRRGSARKPGGGDKPQLERPQTK